jgi:diguanylate cyclase (GGDEF)-like protein
MSVLPLIVGSVANGVLVLYAREPGFFHEEEMRLLEELAADISFAVAHIEKQEQIDYLALYDVLTGLANRVLFLERAAQHLRGAGTHDQKFAMLLIDIERFRNINDSLGRADGDELLRQVAQWLTAHAGDPNLLARVDADRFAMMLPKVADAEEAGRLLENTLTAFLSHSYHLNGTPYRISAKVGVAMFPDHAGDANLLFKYAESAVEKAKASGERYLFYTQTMSKAVAGRLRLENQLRRALERGQYVLHYQPKIKLANGTLVGVEALIRWNEPEGALVPPGGFVPILEETGLIHDVGRWALRQAIDDYLGWHEAGLHPVRVAVNLSPMQLRSRDLVDDIRRILGVGTRAPLGLELELTESLIMEDVSLSIAILRAIRDLGVRIAIDDFGTGFSSLSYLSKLPVDTIKIDGSFVAEMVSSPAGLALVSVIVNLAHSLKLNVVAEGVETEEQSRMLRLLDCDEMQGFFLSKPLPAAQFAEQFLTPAASAVNALSRKVAL